MANQFNSSTLAATMATLKNYYLPGILSQFNDEVPLYREIEKGREKYQGSKVVKAIKVLRNPGVGATSDGGLLPTIGTQTTINAEILVKYNYLRFGITAPMIKLSATDKGAFADQLQWEMSQGVEDLKQNVSRQLSWNGRGDLAVIAANVTASNVITCTGRTSSEDGSKYIFQTMVIDIVNPTTGVYKAQGVTINSVTEGATATVVLNQAVTCAANDIIVYQNSYNLEVQGLLTPLDDGSNNLSGTSTIFAVDRSTYSIFRGNVINGAGGQLTLDMLKNGSNAGKRRGGAKYNYVEMDYNTERFYEKLLISDKRYIGKVKGDGTFSSASENFLEYGGLPIVCNKDNPGVIYMVDTKQWKKYVLAEMEWADEVGQLIPQVDTDSFEARLRLWFNVFCEKPNSQVRIHNYISP